MAGEQIRTTDGIHPAGNGIASRPAVAFLGPVSSYTHQAALQSFPGAEYDLRPTVNIDEVFEIVQRGDVEFGVVPFENSSNGAVIFTLDNLANRYGTCPDISVCGEAYVDVHHFLLGHRSSLPHLVDESGPGSGGSGTATPTAADPHPLRPRARPLGSLSHVRRLYSHPQAWGQCSVFLSAYLKGVETIDVSSTSRAAEMVKEDLTGTSAAISSEIAAEVYGVDILAKCIEDREDNTTRFLIIRKTSRPDLVVPEPSPAPAPPAPARATARKTKSLLSFTVPHHEPGALADVLDCFRKARLNLTSINSRPSLIKAFQYLFFVEIEGHFDLDEEVREAFASAQKVAQSSRWLGSWYSRRID
ncbi:related to bifunctional P-protein (chorismate mutase-P/prephenate dehydratase) [Cephalotrichum gorgonifer]|uniref:prephenate dehydratase n=1 Tax=Cephalotrichum gorgonifer TaxID=2041049 RepID=A0AAE8MZV8_9PEZI|nr:related to bifunctional P-protein (chorismate mutase-P/prephenate dehydratase) [Cephalotrichum gorgonifer]